MNVYICNPQKFDFFYFLFFKDEIKIKKRERKEMIVDIFQLIRSAEIFQINLHVLLFPNSGSCFWKNNNNKTTKN